MNLDGSGQGLDVGVCEYDFERHPRIFDTLCIGIVVSEKSGLRRTFGDSELGRYTPPDFAHTNIQRISGSVAVNAVGLSWATGCDRY